MARMAILESARADGVDLSWEVLQDARCGEPSESDFVQAVAGAAAAVTGPAPSVTCCPGVLETRVYSRLGIPAVAFGPGLIDRMHSPTRTCRSQTLSTPRASTRRSPQRSRDALPLRPGVLERFPMTVGGLLHATSCERPPRPRSPPLFAPSRSARSSAR